MYLNKQFIGVETQAPPSKFRIILFIRIPISNFELLSYTVPFFQDCLKTRDSRSDTVSSLISRLGKSAGAAEEEARIRRCRNSGSEPLGDRELRRMSLRFEAAVCELVHSLCRPATTSFPEGHCEHFGAIWPCKRRAGKKKQEAHRQLFLLSNKTF